MKRILLLLLILLPMITFAEGSFTTIVVWAKDGTKVAYALNDKPQIKFMPSYLIVTTDGVEVSYELEKLACITYSSEDMTAIKDITTESVSFELDEESLLFPSLKPQSTVSLCGLNGFVYFSKTIKEGGEYSFPISSLSNGVYLVSVNGLTYKFQKK